VSCTIQFTARRLIGSQSTPFSNLRPNHPTRAGPGFPGGRDADKSHHRSAFPDGPRGNYFVGAGAGAGAVVAGGVPAGVAGAAGGVGDGFNLIWTGWLVPEAGGLVI
jgi:hypothetical protein